MKRLSCLIAAAALTLPSSALACGNVPPRPYVREAPPERIGENEILAEVELDLDTPLTAGDEGIRFRVRRMIRGEPAVALVVPSERCSGEAPGRASGFIVATRVRRVGDALVVNPVPLERSLFQDPTMTARSTE